ncbi:flagellar biosynthesis repressor FlbT [Sphingomonas sp. KC8]|uniref:flagellar biosynthesis repressor FlbT n=1 Tax=Sphingomonas sp. KC8 TaxID=1030157 RepID=UPI0002488AAA|nr:flagellar biosynthesis repressor FlbT [Sphingomonas sp. KC8]ARS28960.1 flagellar biosynthesis repressor FlbT [Sphingomonas sp. KC8]
MALRISLRDGEKIIVNGAVLRAVGRTDLCVENNVALLRGRDVMTPEDANTPARRLYFACMLAYIDQGDRTAHQHALLEQVREFMGALEAAEAKATCIGFVEKIATADFYRALADCRWLMAYEAEAMGRPAMAGA